MRTGPKLPGRVGKARAGNGGFAFPAWLAVLLALLWLAGCGSGGDETVSCIPPAAQQAIKDFQEALKKNAPEAKPAEAPQAKGKTPAEPAAGQVVIYLDESGSMLGYVNYGPENSPAPPPPSAKAEGKPKKNLQYAYSQVLLSLPVASQAISSSLKLKTFGAGVGDLNAIQYARSAAACGEACLARRRKVKASPRKYPQEYRNLVYGANVSRIDAPLKELLNSPDSFGVIVSDLFLSGGGRGNYFHGYVAMVTKVCHEILSRGRAVGVLGVMSRFDGRIFDCGAMSATDSIPYRGKHPFYVILVGSTEQVGQYYQALKKQVLDRLPEHHFLLFPPPGSEQALSLDGVKVQVEGLSDKLVELGQRYTGPAQDAPLAQIEARPGHGPLTLTYDLSGLTPPDGIPLALDSCRVRLWYWQDGGDCVRSWFDQSVEALPNQRGESRNQWVFFPRGSTAYLNPETIYYIQVEAAGRRSLGLSGPNEWVDKWSFDVSNMHEVNDPDNPPEIFPTNNLKLLIQGLATGAGGPDRAVPVNITGILLKQK